MDFFRTFLVNLDLGGGKETNRVGGTMGIKVEWGSVKGKDVQKTMRMENGLVK